MDDKDINEAIDKAVDTIEQVSDAAEELGPMIKEEVTEISLAGKKWYLSKTVIVNGIALIAFIAQLIAGHEIISAEAQVGIVALINLILRFFTSEKIIR